MSHTLNDEQVQALVAWAKAARTEGDVSAWGPKFSAALKVAEAVLDAQPKHIEAVVLVPDEPSSNGVAYSAEALKRFADDHADIEKSLTSNGCGSPHPSEHEWDPFTRCCEFCGQPKYEAAGTFCEARVASEVVEATAPPPPSGKALREAASIIGDLLSLHRACFRCGRVATQRGRVTFIGVCDDTDCLAEAQRQIDEGHAKNPDSPVPKETITEDSTTDIVRKAAKFIEPYTSEFETIEKLKEELSKGFET